MLNNGVAFYLPFFTFLEYEQYCIVFTLCGLPYGVCACFFLNSWIMYISNQLDIPFRKFFHFIFATLHVSGVPFPSSVCSAM
jgi:hypothetical protein